MTCLDCKVFERLFKILEINSKAGSKRRQLSCSLLTPTHVKQQKIAESAYLSLDSLRAVVSAGRYATSGLEKPLLARYTYLSQMLIL